ncbi:MAG: hypothetical protein H8E41_07315 [Desulfobulbaceae bacterium]|uniref:FeoB-associated Cys-rich membrane protein n=1 Tax=Candidatus Desulfobia pelagia TaxID=2841692 RepID=A0A8J6NCZ0_9BACT|nr:hypothetical protein [Candidatus Desulfobia pelagia]
MTDVVITLLIIGVCATFLAIRAFRSFQGKGSGCGCACAGDCNSAAVSRDKQRQVQTDIRPMPLQEDKT